MTRTISALSALTLTLLLTAFSPDGQAAPAVTTKAPAAPPAGGTVSAEAMATGGAPSAPASPPPSAEAGAAGGATVAEALSAGDEDGEGWSSRSDHRRRWERSDHDRQDPPAVAIAVPIAFFLFVLGIVAIVLVVNFRKDRLRHETLRLIVERGGAIPAELLAGPRKKPSSDLRKGVILLACGIGLGLFLALVAGGKGQDQNAWSMGFIPAFIGLGYLLVWRLERRGADERRDSSATISGAPRAPLSDTARTGRDDTE